MIQNTIVPGDMSSWAPVFLFFRWLNLRFGIYDVASLCLPRKPLVISHEDTNVFIFQPNRGKKYIFFSVEFNVVLKEKAGFA